MTEFVPIVPEQGAAAQPNRRQASSHRVCTWLEPDAVDVGATVLYCLDWPHRRQASSYLYCINLESSAVNVGA
ncbi:hypothetical protein, partial [Pseudomonas sp.]|uniref:hypothetical protein n=1 Tax=Pseudomonas sp. TaxID=306 RepID=UPI003C779D37